MTRRDARELIALMLLGAVSLFAFVFVARPPLPLTVLFAAAGGCAIQSAFLLALFAFDGTGE